MSFDQSARLYAEAGEFVAGGVNSSFRTNLLPHPLVFDHADGAILVDVDGNRIIDYFLGMGPMMLGHRPPSVVAAAKAQLDRSLLVAGQTEHEYEAARLLVDMVPSADLVRFSTSGTEAVQSAFRVARAATGRSKILKFEGHYHGWLDNVLWSVQPDLALAGPREAPNPVPGSEGQMRNDDIVILPWNDADLVRTRLQTLDVAAVIMEPVMFNTSGILPLPGYLEAVREACEATGTLLIFDEVITGFRVSSGGAQQLLGVMPDITILGKALANGFPVAAVVGRREYLNLIGSQRVLQGGTYNTQSVSMAATVATLREIRSGRPAEVIATTGNLLIEGLRDAFASAGVDARIAGYPAVFHLGFGSTKPTDYRSSLATDRARYRVFAHTLLKRGIRVLPRGVWFLSSEHTTSHIEETVDAVKSVLADQ